MSPPRLHVIADDLSGAAECAAALARATHAPAPLVLQGALPQAGSWSADTDSRTYPPAIGADIAAQALRRAAGAGGPDAILFKKIDSTLRGHVAAELRAALAMPGLLQAAVVCPTLPSQGRTLVKGVLHIHGQPQVDRDGHPLDLLRLLGGTDAPTLLLRPEAGATAGELAAQLVAAVQGGTRLIAVDATDENDLRRIAQALVAASGSLKLLAVGAAGLARALANELFAAAPDGRPVLPEAKEGPLVAVVGSFNSVTGRQVDELSRQPDVHLVRLNASIWLAEPHFVREQIERAQRQAGQGQAIVLAATGAMPVQSSRELVQCMAAAADPLIRRAGVLVLTGGDTARTVLDRLRIEQLQVLGEIEPGICLSRAGGNAPSIVTKAGGFGDAGSLVRVLRHFRPAPETNAAPERKE